MRTLLRCCTLTVLLVAAHAADAECSVSSDAGAAARPLNPAVQADTDLIISMTMLPKLMHVDYASAAKARGCDLGRLESADGAYELWGDDSGLRQRKAISAKKGSKVALIVPVIDIMKAITAQKQGKSAQVQGYLLATITPSDFTAWRYYTGMPDPGTLKRDMGDALAGRGNAIFQSGADGKVNLYIPKS
jgi:hypothetical protein